MIYNKTDANKYIEEFSSKFENFGEKAPIVISFYIDDLGVTVKHEKSKKTYFYEWDFSIPVKTFIHKIKQDLIAFHYPRICKKETIVQDTTPERAAELIANGCSVDQVPAQETIEKVITYRIDKVLTMRDEFVLVDEETGDQFCYKMKDSGIYFLKNYREGAFKSLLEAGDAFFKKSTLVAKLRNVNS